jgi:ABC-type Mn2+/Zn2+ transport system ATPase subunit
MIFNIEKESILNKTFNCINTISKYDLNIESVKESFSGKIDIENIDWNVGVIVGPSGTGKSSIANELFKNSLIDLNYSDKAIIDEFGNKTFEEITNAFNKVGLNTPKTWLKPYNVLSNGEKMRCDLAKALLENREIIVFDEFTSVVDRQVAQFGSSAIQKTIRKDNKKFIAVTCHYDILDWLEPDWVFDTKDFTFTAGKMSPNSKDHQSNVKSEKENTANGTYLASIII